MTEEKENDSIIYEEAFNGDMVKVEELIAKGKDLNFIPENRTGTILHCAAFNGNLDLVKTLIAAGANINVTSNYLPTPLHSAVGSGHLAVVNEFITTGADIEIKTSDGQTPLYSAAYRNQAEIVKVLLAAGANVNASTPNDDIVILYWPAYYGYAQVIRELLAAGADINNNILRKLQFTEEIQKLINIANFIDNLSVGFNNLETIEITEEVMDMAANRMKNKLDFKCCATLSNIAQAFKEGIFNSKIAAIIDLGEVKKELKFCFFVNKKSWHFPSDIFKTIWEEAHDSLKIEDVKLIHDFSKGLSTHSDTEVTGETNLYST